MTQPPSPLTMLLSRHTRRREFITLLGCAALSPVAARAQVSPKRPLVAWLSGGAHAASSGFVDAFLQGMRDHGYIEGRDFDIVYRYADGYAAAGIGGSGDSPR